ncbi:MAG TPA: hypothetical protein VFS27_04890 [Blastocatellia bacterium]|nr:hypothetical protein [Blastocatellia bacterium]
MDNLLSAPTCSRFLAMKAEPATSDTAGAFRSFLVNSLAIDFKRLFFARPSVIAITAMGERPMRELSM